MKKVHKGKKAPKGMHFMPNGKLMKDSAHKKKKKPSNRKRTVRKKKTTARRSAY